MSTVRAPRPSSPDPDERPDGDRLQSLAESAPFGLLFTDAKGVIRSANRTLADSLGYRSEELVGVRTFQELLAPGAQIYYDTHVRPILHVQSEVREIALELVRRDGSRWSVLVYARLRGADDAQPGVDTVVFDATNRRSYEVELLREWRLAEQAEARLRVMYDVASGLAAAITTDEIVAVINQRGGASIAGGRCSVWLFGDGWSVVRAGSDEPDAGEPTKLEFPDNSPALRLLAEGGLVVISDRAAKRSEFPLVCQWMEARGVNSAVIAPLRADGSLTGAISYGFSDVHDFDEADRAAAAALALQTEQAMRRAVLVESELRSKQRVEAQLEFTTKLSGALTLDDVFEVVADGSRSLLGAAGFRLALIDDARRSAEFIRGTGIGGRLGLRLPLEARSIGCAAMRTGNVQSAADRNELEELFPDSPILSDPAFGRVVSVPLRRADEILGAWVLAFDKTGPPDPDDLKLMAMFGAQAGEAIQRAALHDADNMARGQADLRRAMSEALNRAATTADVARAITHEGRRAFDAVGLAVFVVDRDQSVLLKLESHSGLDGPATAGTVPIDRLRRAGLSEWAWPWFVTDRLAVAAALEGVVEGVDWGAAALLPLGLPGRELGLIVVGFEDDGASTSAVRATLAGVTAEASVALARARRSDIAHDIAVTLQRSLLPPIEPLSQGWAVSTWYEPGSELVVVGGDLFDVTELDDGRVVVVVGDIVGHGLEAAASMGLLRSAAKALTLVRSRPSDVIAGLQAFAAATPGVMYASVCCIEVRPDGAGRYACAGHPYPLLRHADGRTLVMDGGRSPLLGITAAPPTDAEFQMDAESTLVVFTDGLIDRRGASTDDEVERLRRFVADGIFPQTTARHVVESMLGEESTQDDIVVVCLSRTSATPSG